MALSVDKNRGLGYKNPRRRHFPPVFFPWGPMVWGAQGETPPFIVKEIVNYLLPRGELDRFTHCPDRRGDGR